MASIFKTLDGGHLDRALFSSQASKGDEPGAETKQVPFYRRLRLLRRGEKRAKSGEKRPGAARSDTRP